MDSLESKEELFARMPVMKALMKLGIPTIISQLIHLIYNVADTLFVGQTGNPYMIAGVSLVFPLFMLGLPVCNLFGLGGGGQIARMMGHGDDSEAGSVSSYCFWWSIIICFVYSAVVYLFMDPIMRFLGASDQTIPYSRQYTLLVVVLGTLPTTAGAVLSHLLRNTGYAKQASIGMSGGGILNIILDPLFMFVLFPDGMEVFAAALATLLSNIASLIYLSIVLIRLSGRTPLSLAPGKMKEISPENRRQIFTVGIPSAVLPGLFDIANILLNSLMAAYGDLQLAAIGIVMKVERLSNAFGLGLSQAMMPLVAYNYASGNRKRMKEAVSSARKLGLCIAFSCTIFYLLLAKPLCSLFMNTSAGTEAAAMTLGYSIIFLRIRTLAAPLQFMNFNCSYAMQGMSDGTGAMVHAVLRVLAFYIPIQLLFNQLFGQNGLAIAFPVSEFCGGTAAFLLLRRRIRKTETAE